MKFDQNITVYDFFKDTFCVNIYLRSTEDKDVYSSGRRVLNTQSSILLELNKSSATTKDHTIYLYEISDGLVIFINRDLQRVQY